MEAVTQVTAIIDRQAMRHNLQKIRHQVGERQIMAVIKANGYGHGLLETANIIAQDVDYFAVARINEAMILRSAGINKPILVLGGFLLPEQISLLVDHDIETVIHNNEQLAAFDKIKPHKKVKVWMKIDSGMHRLGFRLEEVEHYYQKLSANQYIEQPIKLLSHFCCADDLTNPQVTIQQMTDFARVTQGKPGLKSLSASAGILFWPEAYYDVVRPGIILYGVSPSEQQYADEPSLQPVMRLASCLMAVRHHKKGETVGYGGIWRSEKDTVLGVVAIGYADGYPRNMPSGAPVLVNGREVPLVGRVSMDMICVDLGAGSKDKIGDEVTLWGAVNLPVTRIAQCSGLSSYELLSKLTARVVRRYIN